MVILSTKLKTYRLAASSFSFFRLLRAV